MATFDYTLKTWKKEKSLSKVEKKQAPLIEKAIEEYERAKAAFMDAPANENNVGIVLERYPLAVKELQQLHAALAPVLKSLGPATSPLKTFMGGADEAEEAQRLAARVGMAISVTREAVSVRMEEAMVVETKLDQKIDKIMLGYGKANLLYRSLLAQEDPNRDPQRPKDISPERARIIVEVKKGLDLETDRLEAANNDYKGAAPGAQLFFNLVKEMKRLKLNEALPTEFDAMEQASARANKLATLVSRKTKRIQDLEGMRDDPRCRH